MPRWNFGKLMNGGIRICECGEVTLEDEMHVCILGDKMTNDPITEIEDEKTWLDFGKQGYLILSGAIEAGATTFEAIQVLTGFYAGMFKGVQEAPKEDNEETPPS